MDISCQSASRSVAGLLKIFLVLTAIATGAVAEDAKLEARQMLAETGIGSHGFCCVLNCGDGALATAIAQNTELLVFALDTRPDKIAAAQNAARQGGLLGKRLYFDVGSPTAIPLTSDYADLLVVDGLTDAQLATLPPPEIVRVLSPRLGRLIAGRQVVDANEKKLTREKLEAWIQSTGLVNARIIENASGLWAVAAKPAKAGADNWSNWQHGPDNNPLSTDTAYAYPDTVQWLNRPFQTGQGFSLAAGGRYFTGYAPDTYQCEFGIGPETGPETVAENAIYAWQGYNGCLLWSRPVDINYSSHRIWIATDSLFYMAEGNAVITLAAENGKELGRITAGDNTEQIVWLSIVDGTAYTLTGAKNGKKIVSGNRLAAYDLPTGKLLWEHREFAPIDYTSIGMSEGKIYFCAPTSRVVALDTKTGKENWSNAQVYLPEDGDPRIKLDVDQPTNTLLLCPTNGAVVVFFGNAPTRAVAFAPNDGHVLWRRKRGVGQSNYALVVGNRLLSNQFKEIGIDLLTGNSPDMRGINGGCGRCTATPNYFVNQFGALLDLSRTKTYGYAYSKDICAIGQFTANGIRYEGAPGSCHCNLPFRGYMAWNSADSKSPASSDDPLFVADKTEPPVVDSTADDWPQYRRDLQHSSSTPVAAGNKVFTNAWRFKPVVSGAPTPATTVGDRVYLSGSDGLVQCLDTRAGKPHWTFQTGGRSIFQPTFSDNRLYVGSSDGKVYCLAAETGNLLWRFRAAQADRRLLVYHELMSRWPVNVNIVAHEDTVFALSGMMDCDGIFAYALDAKSGKVKWANTELGNLIPESHRGFIPMGAVTLSGKKLWFRAFQVSPAALDIDTGALHATPAAMQKNGKGKNKVMLDGGGYTGKDIGVIAGHFLLEGGRRLYCPQSDRTLNSNNSVNTLLELDKDGTAIFPRFALVPPPCEVFFPSWDGELIVNPITKNPRTKQTLQAYSIADLQKSLNGLKEMQNAAWPEIMRVKTISSPASKWTGIAYTLNSLVICKDMVLVTEGRKKASQAPCQMDDWRLTALNRDSGAEIWSIPLPSEPVFDGLTMDAHGRAIVAFADGSVACYCR